MTPSIQVDDQTFKSIEFASRMAGLSSGDIVARLVAGMSAPMRPSDAPEEGQSDGGVAIFADYEGHRTKAIYLTDTRRVDVVEGPLAGATFKSPTGAARAVVGHYKPEVNPNRNGWSFWTLDDGSGRLLQAIRHAL